MSESKKQTVGLVIARALMFAVIYLGVYVLLLLVPLAFADALGILRAFITATISKIMEVVLFEIVRKTDQ